MQLAPVHRELCNEVLRLVARLPYFRETRPIFRRLRDFACNDDHLIHEEMDGPGIEAFVKAICNAETRRQGERHAIREGGPYRDSRTRRRDARGHQS